MIHDPSKILMGVALHPDLVSDDYDVDNVEFFPAGTCVRLDTNGKPANLDENNPFESEGYLGISLGKSLSDTRKISIARSGGKVPVLLELAPARASFELTGLKEIVDDFDSLLIGDREYYFVPADYAPSENDIQVDPELDLPSAAAMIATNFNLQPRFNALYEATSIGPVVHFTAKHNAVVGETIDLRYYDNGNVGLVLSGETFTGGGIGPDFVNKGDLVYFSDYNGKADDPNSAAEISKARYASGVLLGMGEDGYLIKAALVDMLGGL